MNEPVTDEVVATIRRALQEDDLETLKHVRGATHISWEDVAAIERELRLDEES